MPSRRSILQISNRLVYFATVSGELLTCFQNVQAVTDLGAYALVCPHNYGRFNNSVIEDVAGFQTWWKNVAAEFADNKLVMFDTNNECKQELPLRLARCRR